MNKGTAIVGFVLSFIAGMILVWGIGRSPGSSATKEEGQKAAPGSVAVNAGAPKVELFVMSQCPYGVQAENAFADVVKTLGPDIDFHVDFIGKKGPNGDLSSMHGPNELKGNIVQACAMKYAPAKWFEMVLCQNENYKEVATNWEACAGKLGIATDKIAACADGDEGKQLMTESFDRSTAAKASGSPTIMINGEKYQGGRKSGDFMRAICGKFTGEQPAACKNIPEAPKVNVTILSDARCKECNTQGLEGSLKQKIGNPVVTKVDYAEPAGKKLYDEVKPGKLPALIFDATLDADKDAKMAFARGMKEAGQYKVVSVGRDWNPACADEGGCNSDECKLSLFCRQQQPAVPNKVELFIMSQCPFGVEAFNGSKEVLENFKKNNVALDFSVHYIGDGEGDKLTSMHGKGEVDEDLRQVCAAKHYKENNKWMDYMWCRMKDKDWKTDNWQACTGGDTGIDADVIKKCSEGDEGKQLLTESFNYTKASGISGSPSWIVNNQQKFSGRDAETIKTNICKYNQVAGCEAKLSGPPAPPAGGRAAPANAGCGG
ncbi:MAG: thioredoxin domain-containing protein [Polyangiaceae bacterium]|nr:thioredoxin domain-containing protein [Polyangiaceae bacterium]